MSSLHRTLYAAPFDAVADTYDELFTESNIGQAQRASVWVELTKSFQPGDHVLEIGCGTGVDACFLGSRGVQVEACDCSPRMLEVAALRVSETGNSELVRPRLLAAEQISELPGNGLLDGAFSNFGALNCVQDRKRFASDLAPLLRPGATVLLCLMGPSCLWEMIWYLAQGKPSKAFRRFHREGVEARLADGASIHVSYPSVRSLTRSFAPEFRLKAVKGIGLCVPPSYLEPLALRFPRSFAAQKKIDSWLDECPGVRLLADHILLTFERAGGA